MALKKYTDEELVSNLKEYYNKYNKIPTTRDMINAGYPSTHTYISYFGSFKNALIKAGLFELREDQYQFCTIYTDEELLNIVSGFIHKLGYVPSEEETRSMKGFPSSGTLANHFGSYNEAIKLAGFKPNFEYKYRTNEQLINELKMLYLKIRKTPTSRDIAKDKSMAGDLAYIKRFGSLYNAFEIAGIPYYKRSRFYTDEEIIQMWNEHKNRLNKIPTFVELMDIDDKGITHSINYRWGNYYNFIKHLGLQDEYKPYGCKIYETTKGTRCYSYYELKITQWFEDGGIRFDKEVRYSDVIPNDDTYRRFDWVIKNQIDTFYIEMFGIEDDENYDFKKENKIKDCKRNGIKLVEIYPEDMKRPLNEVFSFLFQEKLEVV